MTKLEQPCIYKHFGCFTLFATLREKKLYFDT